jgi:carbonic anhydrase
MFFISPSHSKGSEHLLNDRQFAMEAHIIFMNQKYASINDAIMNADGLAVIGRFFEAKHVAFPPVYSQYLKMLTNTAEVVATTPIPLSGIAPGTNFKYASYKGSLTVPVCREAVTWIVGIEKNVWISNWTIDKFRVLVAEKSVVRAVQPLNGRVLTCRLK